MVEQVVTKPDKADVEIGNGKKVFEICRWYNGSLDCCGLLVVFVAATSPKHVARCCNMSQYFNRCGESTDSSQASGASRVWSLAN